MSLTKAQTAYISSLATQFKLPEDLLLAFIEKESGDVFFWDVGGKQLPAINIEPQYFYRILKKLSAEKLALAVKAGLASKVRSGVHVPDTYSARYAMLDRMAAIDRDAAYSSISIGAGQIMGENYPKLGYPNASAMFADAAISPFQQIRQMVNFIMSKPGLPEAIRKHDYVRCAFLYNGPGYKANHYDTDLRALVDKVHPQQDAGDVQKALLEDRITALGYSGVVAFQTENGLKPDGLIGPATKAKITAVEQARKKQAAKPANKGGAIAAGGAVVVASGGEIAAQSAQNSTSWIDTARPVIDAIGSIGAYGPQIMLVLVAAIVVGAVVYTVIHHVSGKAA